MACSSSDAGVEPDVYVGFARPVGPVRFARSALRCLFSSFSSLHAVDMSVRPCRPDAMPLERPSLVARHLNHAAPTAVARKQRRAMYRSAVGVRGACARRGVSVAGCVCVCVCVDCERGRVCAWQGVRMAGCEHGRV